MKYQIGDKVELDNGCITEIIEIPLQNGPKPIYGTGTGHSVIVPITEDRIIRKIED